MSEPIAPSLADVLPALANAMGLSLTSSLHLPPAPRAVVVLIDGMGARALSARLGHAPWLRSVTDQTEAITAGFPSTTATSMGSFGTGVQAGAHGLVGYEVLDPARDALLNELSWDNGPAPQEWQDLPTVFEQAAEAGVSVSSIGPAYIAGSGLTRAALRGSGFIAADTLPARVDATVAAARSAPRTLTYLYWEHLDKVGHVEGVGSWQWGDELERVDRSLAQLAARLPNDCSLTVTADHGMVDVPASDRIDLAYEPVLRQGVRHVGGEPRAPQIYCAPGAAADVAQVWRARLGDRARVRLREDVIEAGLFGPVRERNLARIGDVVVEATGSVSVVDSARMRPQFVSLIGVHGSSTPEESEIPLVHLSAGSLA